MTLSVATRGAGRDLVLLHGWGIGATVWRGVADELALRFRVHAVDLPGYGGSDACAPYTAERIADALAARLPGRCLVCAWSMGGQAALTWAVKAPSQIERLVLVATTPSFMARPDWPHAMPADVLQAFARSLREDRAGTLQRFTLLQSQGDSRARSVARELQAALADSGEPSAVALEGGLRILMECDLRDDLPTIAQPVLVVHGERDALVPLATAEYLACTLPMARLAVIAGAAHAPFMSSPQQFGTLVAGFFA